MENGSLIGALAIFTIGAGVVIEAFFLRHNRDPKNQAATKEVLKGGPSAHTGVRGGAKPEHVD